MNMNKESHKKLWLRIWKVIFWLSKFISLQCVFLVFSIVFPDIVAKIAESEATGKPSVVFIFVIAPHCIYVCFLFWYFYFAVKLLKGIKG